MIRALIILAALGAASVAQAHDTWADGSAVPEWVTKACCGPGDSHHLTPDQVHPTAGGYRVDGLASIVPYGTVLPSEDGEYWAFYAEAEHQQFVFCFFAPSQGA